MKNHIERMVEKTASMSEKELRQLRANCVKRKDSQNGAVEIIAACDEHLAQFLPASHFKRRTEEEMEQIAAENGWLKLKNSRTKPGVLLNGDIKKFAGRDEARIFSGYYVGFKPAGAARQAYFSTVLLDPQGEMQYWVADVDSPVDEDDGHGNLYRSVNLKTTDLDEAVAYFQEILELHDGVEVVK